ncbi:hypothetical protein TVAG_379220 [Trichomonas vaginalis G3]|uniref:DUF3447 domain-containing protein n=1 Tax=Trichomonas vaginalis (strain ATCC PRA-98 / G3) TaxID=412133 RepID=A2DBB3_TRIV3|nr:protein ubiquitination [Trichomonas vaginalis G3]EAY22443.1 hypothetical protein TVAG_379220 [Trichomonas vaginalis G3]KAI5517604.1 protein ubiquitination [Trichomonas vaginalis G3]|eukprot:XP_001583429.1 hypothetical protein [Trichomonas vaginalis G3]
MEELFLEPKPIEVFEYPNQVSKIIWDINPSNLAESSSQIVNLITGKKISIQMVLFLIDNISTLRVKYISSYTGLYQRILNEFSCIVKPMNGKLATLLFNKGFKFDNFKPQMNEEEIINLYDKESPLYYIAWDKIDELKTKFPTLEINPENANIITPLDCACKFGSELCFNYLRNEGAIYTEESAKYALQAGNQNIFSQMVDDSQSFDNMINIALIYRNYEIAEYLQINFKQDHESIAEYMYYGVFEVASFLFNHEFDINKIFRVLLQIISFLALQHSLSFCIVLLLYIFIIALSHYLY